MFVSVHMGTSMMGYTSSSTMRMEKRPMKVFENFQKQLLRLILLFDFGRLSEKLVSALRLKTQSF